MKKGTCQTKGLSPEKIAAFEERFQKEPRNLLGQNISTLTNPLEGCLNRQIVQDTVHVFQHILPTEGKPITNQNRSGRCWMFSSLNAMRLPFMKEFSLEEFEFSESYLFFWDKVERCHYILHAFVEVAKKKEPVDGQLVQFLLADPLTDGGQWHMLVNLVEKYGVIPKKCFPESFNSESSAVMDDILKHMMRANYVKLSEMVANEAYDADIELSIDGMIEKVYRVVSVCLGSPPVTFSWEYRDKDKNFHRLPPLTPLQFYRQHVKPLYNVQEKICLMNDPRAQNPYEELYTVKYLGNMVGGQEVLFNNQRIEVLKEAAASSIKAGEAVWFGCDVGKQSSRGLGINDMNLFRHELLFGISMKDMTKEERLVHRDSTPSHAMVLVGVTDKEGIEGGYEKWKVENSWGEAFGAKGYLLMTDDWFSEYVYEVVVDKKFVSEEVLKVMNKEPRELPAWDQIGSLA
ncbi:hypothetical protein GJAV_G00128700 [Gymnothorax javanicus]|nr:hypothetical protein GJAV_G00128700 [Gymnothorax javanicus]